MKRRAVFALIATAVAACGAFGSDATATPDPADAAVEAAPVDASRETETLLEGEALPRLIAVRDGSVYWALQSGVVRTCRADACATSVRTLAKGYPRAGRPTGIAVDATYVYFAVYLSQAIYRVPISGGSDVAPVVEYPLGNGPLPYGVAVDEATVYWTEESPDAVRKVLKNEPGSPDAGVLLSNASKGFIRPLAIGDGNLFWLSGDADDPNGRLDTATISGDGQATLAYAIAGPRGIAVSNVTAFVTSWLDGDGGGDGVVYRFVGTTRATLAANQPQPSAIATDGTTVYWANVGDGTIRSCAVAGCDSKESLVVKTGGVPESLAVEGPALYWCDSLTGAIRRIQK